MDSRMGWYVIFGTIPIAVLGFVFRDQIETVARNLWLVATTLIVFGLVLGVADRIRSRNVRRPSDLNIRDGLAFGFGQALALIPGVSRSGATVTAGSSSATPARPRRATRSCSRSPPCSPPGCSRR